MLNYRSTRPIRETLMTAQTNAQMHHQSWRWVAFGGDRSDTSVKAQSGGVVASVFAGFHRFITINLDLFRNSGAISWAQGVVGSNPIAPTISFSSLRSAQSICVVVAQTNAQIEIRITVLPSSSPQESSMRLPQRLSSPP